MKPALWYMLYMLSMLGAVNRRVSLSTKELAESMGFSQQTASRHLIELEKAGYITKTPSLQGMEVKITESGLDELRSVYSRLKTLFEGSPNTVSLEGKVFSGLREGGYYVSMKGYKNQFIRKLGFNPYPGTLNLRLSPSQIANKKEIETYPPIIVEGFKSRRRTFGQVKCYAAIINKEVEGAMIIINRTHYSDDVLELIAPINLREKLKLKEGSNVQVEIFIANTSEDQTPKSTES